ncbi:poly(A)-binding protein binding protein [Diaporthe eres]
MVQQKKAGSADAMNGSTKRQQNNMSFARGNVADARVLGGNQNNRNGKQTHTNNRLLVRTSFTNSPQGNRAGFQTDSGISGERFGGQRELKRWVADGPGDVDGSLEKATDNKPWDQFAANEEKFGLKTDYDENIYTTAIDRSHPSYKTRMAKADQMAREIERSNPVSSHVAEERVMDYSGPADGGLDEEEKYSGVKRPDFPPLASQNPNKYTPPARRAPAAQSNVKGAPVDPAIISSQLRSGPSKQPTPKPDESKVALPSSSKTPTAQNSEPKTTEAKTEGKTEASKDEVKPNDTEKGQSDSKPAEKPASTLRPAGAAGRTTSPADKENAKPTSTTIEQTVLTSFKNFASKERQVAEKARSTKAKADKEVKLIELKKFADSFKLGTPVPNDLIGIIAKDPKKQQEIQAKALKNAEESRKAKEDAKKDPVVTKEKEVTATKPGQSKPAAEQTASSTTGTPAAAAAGAAGSGTSRPGVAPQHANSTAGAPNRHPGNRQSYAPGSYPQQFRGDRSSGQNVPRQHQQPGHLSQRLRSAEQQRMSQPPPHMQPDMRMPPTGPANSMNPSFPPRHTGLPPNHMGPGPRLNPNTQEFRPNAQPFYPTGPSAASSPRSAMNNVEGQGSSTPVTGPVIKRKIKSIDFKKCFALSHVMSIKQPQTGNRAWEENGGLRPPFDTQPTWNSLSEGDDKQEKISYKQLFERPPPYAGAMPTPNPAPVAPQMPHQHQLPFHLQQGAHAVGPRQSPHMPPLQMHAGQPGHAPHMPFNNGEDATRMMPSSSAQSYASPRPGQVPMAYPNTMNSPAHMPYSQPVMPGFMGPGAPQMTPQMRNFAQNPQYMPQQHAQMGGPMMMGPQYMTAPSPLMQGGPQMPMYAPGGHPQFMPPGPVPPPAMPGSNGYPSPGRPAAPMMAPQGSQQGQHMYGMSPGTMPQYQQPVFAPQQPGQTTLDHSNSAAVPNKLITMDLSSIGAMDTVERILPAPIKGHQQITVALLLPRPGRLKHRMEPNDDAFLVYNMLIIRLSQS